ncbi:MAG: cytochrome c biogenesis protein [Bacteroidia bacterium]|jgi:heme exporter protein C|nr:cytochrome c biogenesis protein [Bacteroidia bacterium]
MKLSWWKWACVVLLIYTFTAGLLVPMAPGILRVSPDNLSTAAAPFTVKVHGYNTRFLSNQNSLQAWLLNDKTQVAATTAKALSETEAELTFPALAPLQKPVFDLFVNDDADGTLVMASAIATTDSISAISPVSKISVKNEKEDYFAFPFQHILYESIRNLFFHVPMWFAMIALMAWAVFNNIRYLRGGQQKHDLMAAEAVNAGLVFGVLGLLTGSLWARVTWGSWWVDDIKLNGTAITMLAYMAYVVLRGAVDDEQKRARISAVYSIFAFVMMLVLIGVLPRLSGNDSLHPGNGGNPAFGQYDLDSHLRAVFYAACLGWILLGFWVYNLRYRIRLLNEKIHHA